MNNASQLKERGVAQYFSEEGKKEYYQNKATEKEEKKRLQNEGIYEKNKEICKEAAKLPTLISEGISGKKIFQIIRFQMLSMILEYIVKVDIKHQRKKRTFLTC